jgi:hypothetical protein
VKTWRKRRALRAQQTRFGHGNKNEKKKKHVPLRHPWTHQFRFFLSR